MPFLGYLYASVVFDSGVDRASANFFLRLADRLSFRQLICVAILAEGGPAELADRLFGEELGVELDELTTLGIVGVGRPRGDVLPPGGRGLSGDDQGEHLQERAARCRDGDNPRPPPVRADGTRGIPESDRREVLDLLWTVRPSETATGSEPGGSQPE